MTDINATLTTTVITATVTNPAGVTAPVSSSPITATLADGNEITASISSSPIESTLLNGGTITATISIVPITAVINDAIPAGVDTNIQYNDGGVFGGDAYLTWNKTTKVLTVEGSLTGNDTGTTTADLRWETDTEPNALFVDASADGVYLGGTTNSLLVSKGGIMTMPGTSGIEMSHLMQSDSTTQAIANIAAAQVITFDTDVHHKNIIRTSSSRFTITKKGSYFLTFSGVADLATGANRHIEAWLRLNGNDVANSNTRVELAGNVETIIAVNFLMHFDVNDYFEFWTWGDSTSCRWLATAAATGPVRPAVPSIIITCNYVSYD